MQVRKRPVVVEAFQMTEDRRVDHIDWPEWLIRAWKLKRGAPGSVYPTDCEVKDGTVSIATLEGECVVSFGDWIIKGVSGELYPCKPDIFETLYEFVDESERFALTPHQLKTWAKLDFVFMDDRKRYYRVKMYRKKMWVFYRHADKTWIPLRALPVSDLPALKRQAVSDAKAKELCGEEEK